MLEICLNSEIEGELTNQNQKKKFHGWILFIRDSGIRVYVCPYFVAKEA